MSIDVKTCDCFFDVGLFAKMNRRLKYDEIQQLCISNQIKTFFLYYHYEELWYIICCKNFLIDCFQTTEVKNSQKIQGLIVWIVWMKMIAFAVLNTLNCKNTVLHVK